jgi:hypothetical protein
MKRHLKKAINVLLFFVFAIQLNPVWAQSKNTIIGKVVDGAAKEAIIGATVSVKGKPIGGVTDADGKFSFTINQPLPVSLIVNFLGYERRQVDMARTTVNVIGNYTATVVMAK